jgi:hypothetical protein
LATSLLRCAAGASLLLSAPFFLIAQSHAPAHASETHHYDLRDPALARAAQRYDIAQEKGDRAELEKLVADDYVIFGSTGVTNKAGLIEELSHPGLHADPYTIEKPFTKDLGDTVILGGWVDQTGTDQGKPFVLKARFADIWHKGPKGWQVVFTQVTHADKP